MLSSNRGHIVTIASSAGLFGKYILPKCCCQLLHTKSQGVSKLTDYCSSKYAAVGLHDALTAELKQKKKHGIQTTVVCPAFINTGMFHGVSLS